MASSGSTATVSSPGLGAGARTFEVSSALLMVAIVGAVAVARGKHKHEILGPVRESANAIEEKRAA